jgi:hypothetical protein
VKVLLYHAPAYPGKPVYFKNHGKTGEPSAFEEVNLYYELKNHSFRKND